MPPKITKQLTIKWVQGKSMYDVSTLVIQTKGADWGPLKECIFTSDYSDAEGLPDKVRDVLFMELLKLADEYNRLDKGQKPSYTLSGVPKWIQEKFALNKALKAKEVGV